MCLTFAFGMFNLSFAASVRRTCMTKLERLSETGLQNNPIPLLTPCTEATVNLNARGLAYGCEPQLAFVNDNYCCCLILALNDQTTCAEQLVCIKWVFGWCAGARGRW